MNNRKKLIEVALPLDAINQASAREKSIRHGHPSTMHLWWARRPLAARVVIFAQMVDDPSANPDLFPTEEAQERKRKQLFRIIEDLVQWENTTNETVLRAAREEILASWWRICRDRREWREERRERLTAEELAHDEELFNPRKLPAFHDPFAGGGSLPLEAQRLGLEAYASDLNPVAVLINKAMIEIPPKFAGRPPANPDSHKDATLFSREWRGTRCLAEDVRYYGQWMRDEAEKRIGHLYPKIEVTDEMAKGRPDLNPYVGRRLTVIAWLWARTVKSPNLAFAHVDVPLVSTFMLSTRAGKEAYVEPVIEDGGYRFTVKVGKPKDVEAAKWGTKLSRGANFRCLMSGEPMAGDYIRAEGRAGRMGVRLMAIVVEGDRGRVYLAPTPEHEALALEAKASWKPDGSLPDDPRNFWTVQYGLTTYGDLFTSRQLVALTTFSELVGEAIEQVKRDALAAGMPDDGKPLRDGGTGATAYAEAVGVYLGICVSRQANRTASLNFWDQKRENVQQVFARQALPMTWNFVEGNPLSSSTGNFVGQVEYLRRVVEASLPASPGCSVQQCDAQNQNLMRDKLVSTDPPYYDNIGYADLSDFFYVWLRRSLLPVFPDLFATPAVPRAEELVATPYRHGSKEKAGAFFLNGMTRAMRRIAEQAHPEFPVTIYYAFKGSGGVSGNAGWEAFLGALRRVCLRPVAAWPIRTECAGRLNAQAANALLSSVVLVCRRAVEDAPVATMGEFVSAVRERLEFLLRLAVIPSVDLFQAAIGVGMSVFFGYSRVKRVDGSDMSIREALDVSRSVLDDIRIPVSSSGEETSDNCQYSLPFGSI